MNEEQGTATESASVQTKPAELRNSHWCIHPSYGLGMIGETGARTSFHVYDAEAKAVKSTPEMVELSDLTLCTPEQLPEHLGYTPQQLVDLGYSR